MSGARDDTPRHMAGGTGSSPPARPAGAGDGQGGPPAASVAAGAGPGRPGRRRARWVLPAALALVAAGAGAAAVALSGDTAAEAVGIDRVAATPVLSARRAPEVVAAPVADRRLVADLDAWLSASPPDTCLLVATEGRDAYRHNATAPLTGASTQKLLTTTGLLLALGPDATFTTGAVAAVAPRDGVVDGDLFLVGGGPADLGTPDWPTMAPGTRPRVVHDIGALADAIAAAGVTRITGSVVGDGSRYDDQRYNPSLAPRLVDQDQVGPISGLMVNDGFADFGPSRTNAATVPAADPAADAARVLTGQLVARGVAVGGSARSGATPRGATTVATLDSPPVRRLVADTLTTSDNEAAEAALKEIGVATRGEGSWAAGAAGLAGLLDEAGVPVDGLRVVDGSGLSTEDRLSCDALADVLTRPGTGPVLRAGLAVAGRTGTLADRFTGTPVEGHLRAKTGTLRNVTALAGQVDGREGRTLTFAYVANVADPGEVTADEVGVQSLAEILLAYPRGVDLEALGPRPAAPAPRPG